MCLRVLKVIVTIAAVSTTKNALSTPSCPPSPPPSLSIKVCLDKFISFMACLWRFLRHQGTFFTLFDEDGAKSLHRTTIFLYLGCCLGQGLCRVGFAIVAFKVHFFQQLVCPSLASNPINMHVSFLGKFFRKLRRLGRKPDILFASDYREGRQCSRTFMASVCTLLRDICTAEEPHNHY